jgi:hypothetical protein
MIFGGWFLTPDANSGYGGMVSLQVMKTQIAFSSLGLAGTQAFGIEELYNTHTYKLTHTHIDYCNHQKPSKTPYFSLVTLHVTSHICVTYLIRRVTIKRILFCKKKSVFCGFDHERHWFLNSNSNQFLLLKFHAFWHKNKVCTTFLWWVTLLQKTEKRKPRSRPTNTKFVFAESCCVRSKTSRKVIKSGAQKISILS